MVIICASIFGAWRRPCMSRPPYPSHPDSAYTGLPFDTVSTVNPAEVFELLSIIPPKSCSMDFIPIVLMKSCQTALNL